MRTITPRVSELPVHAPREHFRVGVRLAQAPTGTDGRRAAVCDGEAHEWFPPRCFRAASTLGSLDAMSSSFSVDPGVLLVGVLLLVGVIASGFTSRFRIPSLLLFLGLGMAVADDGLAWIRFDDAVLAQNIAIAALAVILFGGGAITAGIVALAAWGLIGLDPTTALLLGAVISSTDAAAVFTALRTEPLPTRTSRLLQLESGLNDPAAVLLTVGMVEVWRQIVPPARRHLTGHRALVGPQTSNPAKRVSRAACRAARRRCADPRAGDAAACDR